MFLICEILAPLPPFRIQFIPAFFNSGNQNLIKSINSVESVSTEKPSGVNAPRSDSIAAK